MFLSCWALLRLCHLFLLPAAAIARVDHVVALATATVTRSFGIHSEAVGDGVFFPGGAMTIADPCNGIELLEILLALVLACPVDWNARGFALLWMVPTLAAINLVRLCSLVPVLVHWPDAFDTVHQFVWQILMVAVVLTMSIAWMRREVGRVVARPSH